MESLTPDQLTQLREIIEDHIGTLERQEMHAREKIMWNLDTWDPKMAKNYELQQKLRVDLERIWHLKLALQEWINKKMNQVIVRSGINLGMGLDDLSLLSREFGEDIIAVLGAGWLGPKEIPEA